MQDKDKTKEQLIAELHELHQRLAEWEKDKAKRKRAEEALRESQERLSLALESSRVGAWDRNVVENKSIWDKYHHRLFGFAPS